MKIIDKIKKVLYKCYDCGYEFYNPKGGRCPNCGWDRFFEKVWKG